MIDFGHSYSSATEHGEFLVVGRKGDAGSGLDSKSIQISMCGKSNSPPRFMKVQHYL